MSGLSHEQLVEKISCLAKDFSSNKCIEINSATKLKELDFDSLDNVELVLKLEDEFKISISDEEAAKLETIGGIVTLVESKTNC